MYDCQNDERTALPLAPCAREIAVVVNAWRGVALRRDDDVDRRRRRCRDSQWWWWWWWDATAADSYVTRCGRQDSTGATRLRERADQSSREARNELPRARSCLSLSFHLAFLLSFRFPGVPRLSPPSLFLSFALRLPPPVLPALPSSVLPLAVRFYVVICSSPRRSYQPRDPLRDFSPLRPLLAVSLSAVG